MPAPTRFSSSRTPTAPKRAAERKSRPMGTSAGLDCVSGPAIGAGRDGLVLYRRDQVWVLHRTAMTQPFILSELPDTVPEPE